MNKYIVLYYAPASATQQMENLTPRADGPGHAPPLTTLSGQRNPPPNRSLRGGAVAQRLRGRPAPTPANRDQLPLCLRHLPPLTTLSGQRNPIRIAPPEGELSRSD